MAEEPIRPLIHDLEEPGKNWKKMITLPSVVILVILAGVGTGYLLAGKAAPEGAMPKVIKSEKIVGSTDVKTFRDSTEGVLEKGGIDGEGSHKLIRPGGPSQTAYLTSSIIDLDQYVGKKVKVWGETFKAEKAGWLMDVGKLEILE